MLKGRDLSDNRFQLDALDGLRGFAMLLVFLAHASNLGMHVISPLNFSGNGRAGVYLFFVLSAFLLTHPFLVKRDAGMTPFLLNYAVRRVFRIYPLYSLCLLAGFISTLFMWRILGSEKPWGVPFTLNLEEFWKHLLLQEGKGITWSIVVEFHYYFFLPILALTFSRILDNRLIPCMLLTAALIAICQYIWPQSETRAHDIRLGPYLPLFFTGSFLAVLHYNWNNSRLARARHTPVILETLGILSLAATFCMTPMVAIHFVGDAITLDYFHREFIAYSVFWSIVLFVSVNGNGILKRFFELPFMRYLGFVSFSMYLLHLSIISKFDRLLGTDTFLDIWLALALCIAASHITWTLIEKPSSRVRLKKPAKPAKPPAIDLTH